MSYSNQTIHNRSFIKRFSHQGRFNVALKLLPLKPTDSLLDFGTGDGYLLKLISEHLPFNKLIGYEPLPEMHQELLHTLNDIPHEQITAIKNLDEVSGESFDYVTCLEVLEHFSEEGQLQHLKSINHLTHQDSTILISVPIEIGLTALFKNSIRLALGQKHSNSSFKNIVKAILGFKDVRTQKGYLYSHVGFNHKNLETLFEASGFKLMNKQYSPIGFLRGLLNSQVFYVLKKV